jgi:hypothetical protein
LPGGQRCADALHHSIHLTVTADELAAAREAVAAGAEDVHLDPKDRDGQDTLEATAVAAAVSAVRAVPGVPRWGHRWCLGSGSCRAGPGPDRATRPRHRERARGRSHRCRRGSAGPGNRHRSRHPFRYSRGTALHGPAWISPSPAPLAEFTETTPAGRAPRRGRPAGRTRTGCHAYPPARRRRAARPILQLAASGRVDTRIGPEDVLHLPDGTPAPGNAALVLVAREIIQRTPRSTLPDPDHGAAEAESRL